MNDPIYPCRVCGLDQGFDQWNPPTYFICPCCGVEFGYDDATPEDVRGYRQRWLNNDLDWIRSVPDDPEARDLWLANTPKWFDPDERPRHWDFAIQMQNIPDEYR